jgi:hypothetical protein
MGNKCISLYQQVLKHEEVNVACARLIAADPVRYPGVFQDWAQLVLNRAGEQPGGQGNGEERCHG